MFLTKDSLTSRDSSISFIYYVIATHAKDNHSQNYQTHSDPVVAQARSTPLLYIKQSFKWKTFTLTEHNHVWDLSQRISFPALFWSRVPLSGWFGVLEIHND